MQKKKSVHVSISLPSELNDRVEFDKGDVSKSRFIRRIIERWAESEKEPDPVPKSLESNSVRREVDSP